MRPAGLRGAFVGCRRATPATSHVSALSSRHSGLFLGRALGYLAPSITDTQKDCHAPSLVAAPHGGIPGLGVRKSDPALKHQLDAVFSDWKRSGRLQAMLNQWIVVSVEVK
jgi:hypothetical protein